MKLNNNQLQAFYQIAIDQNFHKAANNINITQSALSQRLLKLEEGLGITLIIRANNGIALTDAGEQLFNHAQDLIRMEEEVLTKITGKAEGKHSGVLRIASYSSILHSAIIPTLSPLIQQSPHIHVEFSSREMTVMPAMLKSGEVDFITLDHFIQGHNLEGMQIGTENLVHIQNKYASSSTQVFLDHDVNDMTTLNFFKQQKPMRVKIRRSYYDDIYGILAGVKNNLGQAVISRHLIPDDDDVICVPHSTPITTPVVLYYNNNRYLTKLQKEVISTLKHHLCDFL